MFIYIRVSFRSFGKGGANVGLELKRGGMLAALARPLEGGLRFQGGEMPPPPKRNPVYIYIYELYG